VAVRGRAQWLDLKLSRVDQMVLSVLVFCADYHSGAAEVRG